MEKQSLEQVIDEVVSRTFENMTNLYKKTGIVNTLLVFPEYTRGNQKGSIRVSEQELRQLFIEELTRYVKNTSIDLQYSVETPTIDGYRFTGDAPKHCDDGRAGRFDLTIWSAGKRCALIEFKFSTAGEHEYHKDLCKLSNKKEGSSDVLRYFINVFEGADEGTVGRLREILATYKNGERTVHLRFHSLKDEEFDKKFPTQIY